MLRPLMVQSPPRQPTRPATVTVPAASSLLTLPASSAPLSGLAMISHVRPAPEHARTAPRRAVEVRLLTLSHEEEHTTSTGRWGSTPATSPPSHQELARGQNNLIGSAR